MLEKTLESPLGSKEIQPVHPKGNQSWILIGRTDAKAEAPVLWPPDAKNWFTGNYSDAGKDWGQKEKAMTEDEMVGWHHWLDGHEFERSPGIGDRQGSLACYSPWGHKQLDMTEQLKWTDVMNMAEHKLSLSIRVLLLAGRREMNWRRQQFLPQPRPPISSFSPTVPWLTSVLCLVCISILCECELIFILHKKRLST